MITSAWSVNQLPNFILDFHLHMHGCHRRLTTLSFLSGSWISVYDTISSHLGVSLKRLQGHAKVFMPEIYNEPVSVFLVPGKGPRTNVSSFTFMVVIFWLFPLYVAELPVGV